MKPIFKHTLSLALALLMLAALLVGCGGADVTSAPDTTTAETTPPEPIYAGDFAEPYDSPTDVADGDYISVTAVDSQYVTNSGSVVYVNAKAPQMSIGGIIHPNDNKGEFYRLDATKKTTYSAENSSLAAKTSGVTIRFRTNADYIILKAVVRSASTGYKHFTDRGAYGFDVYTGTGTNRVYCGGEMQFMTDANSVTERITLPGGYQEVTVNLPLYGGVSLVQIGFPTSAEIAPPTERTYGQICFYGSSITQGGCVSRPGLSYSNIVCRMLNTDNMNLGFSGAAKGEQSVAEYIAASDISAFVMDYDHNNTVAGLRDTHYAFYETVRAAHPDIPIIMVSRPIFESECTDEQIERQEIIRASYDRAIANGDKNVYFVNGNDFFMKEMPDLYTVDFVHPNDLGHYYMAKAIFSVLAPAMEATYPDAR